MVWSSFAQAERVTGRVEEHAKRLSRLFGGFARTDLEHGLLSNIEVVDDDVEVHLLRVGLTRLAGRVIVLDLLNAQRGPGIGGDFRPGAVLLDRDLPIEELPVELCEFGGVRSIEYDHRLLCDSHDLSLRRSTDMTKGPTTVGVA